LTKRKQREVVQDSPRKPIAVKRDQIDLDAFMIDERGPPVFRPSTPDMPPPPSDVVSANLQAGAELLHTLGLSQEPTTLFGQKTHHGVGFVKPSFHRPQSPDFPPPPPGRSTTPDFPPPSISSNTFIPIEDNEDW